MDSTGTWVEISQGNVFGSIKINAIHNNKLLYIKSLLHLTFCIIKLCSIIVSIHGDVIPRRSLVREYSK